MTQEEKARAYDKAIKRAKSLIGDTIIEESGQHIAEVIFPELKENEDDRIRKAILSTLKDLETVLGWDFVGDDVDILDAYAWLEKQGGITKLSEEEQNRFAKGVLTSCALSFIDYLDAHKYEGKMCVSNGECEDIENAFQNALWDRLHRYYCKYIEKQGEEKSTKKTEPKFHKGEWITNGDYTWKIVEVKPLDYILQSQDGNIVDDTISHVDEQFHLWSIEGAKDGDVLVVPPIKGSEHSEQIFIFKEIKDREYVKNAVEYYCRCMDNEFASNERGFMGQSDDYFTPATKEQRDTLMKAMTDAGYTFDFDKKELRKRNSYCQKHCKGFQETGKCFADGDCKDKREAKQNPTWSERMKRNLKITFLPISALITSILKEQNTML